MEPTDEFRDIGKKLPYQTPGDFLEKFTEQALEKAKQRERRHKRMVFLWRQVSVAASLLAVALLSYLITGPGNSGDKQLVQEKQPVVKVIPEKQSVNQEINKNEAVKKDVQEKSGNEASGDERMSDVLADLSDEELMQLAAMYKADSFIDEAVPNN